MGTFVDIWFAWYPVKEGPLGRGRWLWLKKVYRSQTWYIYGYSVFYRELKEDGTIKY